MATTWLDQGDRVRLGFQIQPECHLDNRTWPWEEVLRCIITMITLEDPKETMMLAVCFTRCDDAIKRV